MTTYTPKHLEKWTPNVSSWDTAANYIGGDFSFYYVAPCTRNRESSTKPLTQSNWEFQLDALGHLDGVRMERFGHWACGWYELVLIAPDAGEALEAADELAKDFDRYPVLDEDRMSELEQEAIEREWKDYARFDFRGELACKFEDNPSAQEWVKDMPDDEVNYLYWETCDHLGCYPEYSEGGTSFPINEIVKAISPSDLPDPPPMPALKGCSEHAPKPAFGCQACLTLRSELKPYHGLTSFEEPAE